MSILGGVTDFFSLDIGFDRISVVQLKGVNPVKSFWRWGSVEVEPSLIHASAPELVHRFRRILANLIEAVNIKCPNVVVSLPNVLVQTRIFELEKLSSNEIESTIALNTRQWLRGRSEEYEFDWLNLGPINYKDPASKIEVLVSAVEKKSAEEKLDIIEGAKTGLNVIAFEPRGLAIGRSVTSRSARTGQLIIDLEYEQVNIILTLNGQTRLITASQTSLGNALSQINNLLRVDRNEARQLLIKVGLDKQNLEGRIRHICLSIIDNIVTDIRQSANWFKDRYQQPVQEIILVGPGCQINQLAQYIQDQTKIKTEIGNAWLNVAYNPEQGQHLLSNSHLFTAAVGLAERN